jgi:dephospho-CoA kinase
MRVIGLTGTIGAGKSTVLGWLAELGARTYDADAIAHQLYESDADLHARLASRFGPSVVVGGHVDRRALGAIVFANPDDPGPLAALEAIVHPAVQQARDAALERAQYEGVAVSAVEAIKLVESGGSARCDELWIVTAREDVQLARLAARGVAPDEARRRLARQGTVASWTAAFQAESGRLDRMRPVVVFDNSGGAAQGRAQVARLWPGLVAPASTSAGAP